MSKQTYVVYVPERHIQKMVVDAANESDAIRRVREGEGYSEGPAYYSATLEDAYFEVELHGEQF